jgi:hypothetical protein
MNERGSESEANMMESGASSQWIFVMGSLFLVLENVELSCHENVAGVNLIETTV